MKIIEPLSKKAGCSFLLLLGQTKVPSTRKPIHQKTDWSNLRLQQTNENWDFPIFIKVNGT